MKEKGDFMTVRQIADFLGVHYNTVLRIPASELPFFVVGDRGDRRYTKTDVDHYIKRRAVRG
jgi:excisionase family DNA binding protein